MLKVTGLCKQMNDKFRLQNVSFEVPDGMIVGFVGTNGAGKTTTLKCIINAFVPDSGKIEAFGLDIATNEEAVKKRIGYSAGAFEYFNWHRAGKLAQSYASFFEQWDEELFRQLCARFDVDLTKRIKEMSQGTKVKFGLALALSHNADLYIFDEPTAGLDPIVRDEVLDIFREIVLDGSKSILFSTHITGDLDKCADRVVYIDSGKIVLDEAKDELLDKHALVHGGEEQLAEIERNAVAIKRNEFGFVALVERSKLANLNIDCTTEKPTLEDIMVFYNKELHG